MINFAHGEIYMLGGYAGVLGIGLLVTAGVVGLSIPLAIVLAFLFGIVVCAAVGAAMERVAYRPLRGAPALSPLISAIGSSFFLWNFVMVCQGNLPKRVPGEARDWLVNSKVHVTGDLEISYLEIGILAVSILMMICLQIFIDRTRLGKAMRATSQDRTMASLVGIPIDRVITATFMIGSALAAVAGLMVAMYVSVIQYLDGYLPGIKAFTAAVMGGIGNVPGAMVGGFALGITENLAMWEGSRIGVAYLLVGVISFCFAFFPAKRLRRSPTWLKWIVASVAGIAAPLTVSILGVNVGEAGVVWLLVGVAGFCTAYFPLMRLLPDPWWLRWCAGLVLGVLIPVLLWYLDVRLPAIGFLGRADYKHVYAFVILILVLIFRPRGILGERVAEKV
jgi:branched-chain amino acid transport system permease protein